MRPRHTIHRVVCSVALGVLPLVGCQNASDKVATKTSSAADPPQAQQIRAQQAQGAAADAQKAAAAMAGQSKGQ